MLRIQMIGLAIMAALAMSAVAVSSASAEAELHQWLINGKLLASPVKVHSLGLLLLEDTKATGGAVSVHCHGFDAGTVGPHGLDLIESITLELLGTKDLVLCLFAKAGLCNTSVMPRALALNLPWHTLLVLEGTEVRDLLLGDGHGEPGWNVTCEGPLGPVEDDCLAEPAKMPSTALKNVAGGVLATFQGRATEPAKCSIGGAGAGFVTGEALIESPGAEAKLTFI